jgi:hypothetical protein
MKPEKDIVRRPKRVRQITIEQSCQLLVRHREYSHLPSHHQMRRIVNPLRTNSIQLVREIGIITLRTMNKLLDLGRSESLIRREFWVQKIEWEWVAPERLAQK